MNLDACADAAPDVLCQLHDACQRAVHSAEQLAARPEADPPLRHLLQLRAAQYREAAADFALLVDLQVLPAPSSTLLDSAFDADPLSAWEQIEWTVLTIFRDAFDAQLQEPAAEAVKRHLEAGLDGLKRLRMLRLRDAA